MSGRRSTSRLRVVAAVAVLVVLLALPWFHFGGSEENFVFLFLWENNTAALQYAAPEQLIDQAAWFNEDTRSLTLRQRKDRPTRRTKVVVYYQSDSLDTRLASRVYLVSRFPFEVPVSEPIELVASVADKSGRTAGSANIVDNRRRLLGGNLRLTGVQPDGAVLIEYAGDKITVAPGSGWQEGRVLRDGTVSVIPGERWDETVEAALANGLPLTRLSLVNHGWWKKAGVSLR